MRCMSGSRAGSRGRSRGPGCGIPVRAGRGVRAEERVDAGRAGGEVSPDGMQRLLRHADWDTREVRDDVRDYVIEQLGDPAGC